MGGLFCFSNLARRSAKTEKGKTMNRNTNASQQPAESAKTGSEADTAETPTNEGQPSAPETPAANQTVETTGQQPEANGNQERKPQGGEKTLTQSEVDDLIKERLARAKKKWSDEAKAKTEAAEAEAEAKRLEEEERWKELAEKRASAKQKAEQELATIKEDLGQQLDKANDELQKALEVLGGYLEKEREGLPAHITALLDTMSAYDQLDYLSQHRESLRPSTKKAPTPTPNSGSEPTQPEGKTLARQFLESRGLIKS